MAAVERLLHMLNPDQRAAVEHGDGPLHVIAGAGTGKTRVLIARVAWLIATDRARPEEICALALMNDAANQAAGRLREAVGPAAARVWAGVGVCSVGHGRRSPGSGRSGSPSPRVSSATSSSTA